MLDLKYAQINTSFYVHCIAKNVSDYADISLQDKTTTNQILLRLQIMDNNLTNKAHNDEFVYFRPLKDGLTDTQVVMKEILKNQRRIMMALEVKSYYTLLHLTTLPTT
jgi:hypothetical protein